MVLRRAACGSNRDGKALKMVITTINGNAFVVPATQSK
jgi:hypothetical protein